MDAVWEGIIMIMIGGVLWFGLDDANMTVFTPVYCNTDKVPYKANPRNPESLAEATPSSPQDGKCTFIQTWTSRTA